MKRGTCKMRLTQSVRTRMSRTFPAPRGCKRKEGASEQVLITLAIKSHFKESLLLCVFEMICNCLYCNGTRACLFFGFFQVVIYHFLASQILPNSHPVFFSFSTRRCSNFRVHTLAHPRPLPATYHGASTISSFTVSCSSSCR